MATSGGCPAIVQEAVPARGGPAAKTRPVTGRFGADALIGWMGDPDPGCGILAPSASSWVGADHRPLGGRPDPGRCG
jgi:hypothetical protein